MKIIFLRLQATRGATSADPYANYSLDTGWLAQNANSLADLGALDFFGILEMGQNLGFVPDDCTIPNGAHFELNNPALAQNFVAIQAAAISSFFGLTDVLNPDSLYAAFPFWEGSYSVGSTKMSPDEYGPGVDSLYFFFSLMAPVVPTPNRLNTKLQYRQCNNLTPAGNLATLMEYIHGKD